MAELERSHDLSPGLPRRRGRLLVHLLMRNSSGSQGQYACPLSVAEAALPVSLRSRLRHESDEPCRKLRSWGQRETLRKRSKLGQSPSTLAAPL